MVFWLIAALLAHLASIASLYPALAAQLSPQSQLWIFSALFPLMAISSHVHGRLRDEQERAASFAVLVVGVGVTYLGLIALDTFDISFGAADPFAAREQAGSVERIVWFAGFSGVLLIGNIFFIGKPWLALSGLLFKPLRGLAAAVQYSLVAALGLAVGVAVGSFLATRAAERFAIRLHGLFDQYPVLIAVFAAAVPVLLAVLRAALAGRSARD